jgi:hypothetical protein
MPRTVESLLNTSVDDCKSSLEFITDLTLLRRLYVRCIETGHKTRAKYVNARINKLKGGKK